MSIRIGVLPKAEQKYPGDIDQDAYLRATTFSAVCDKASQWGIDSDELFKVTDLLSESFIRLRDKSACQLFLHAEMIAKRKVIEDLEAQIRIQMSSPISGKIERATAKLIQLEGDLAAKELALKEATIARDAAAVLHREACAIKANQRKSSQAKTKTNGNWPEIQRNKSQKEDQLRKAEAAYQAAILSKNDQEMKLSLLRKELDASPSFDIGRVEQRIRRLHKEIGIAAEQDQKLEAGKETLLTLGGELIEKFIRKHFSQREAEFQEMVRSKLRFLMSD